MQAKIFSKTTGPIVLGQIIKQHGHSPNKGGKLGTQYYIKKDNLKDDYTATKTNLLTQIKAVYTKEIDLQAIDRFPFSQQMTEWPKYSTMEMKAWLIQNIAIGIDVQVVKGGRQLLWLN
eukprot:15362675-Ditylum_brightwellii.AAC.1